jgi:hypothetical protein
VCFSAVAYRDGRRRKRIALSTRHDQALLNAIEHEDLDISEDISTSLGNRHRIIAYCRHDASHDSIVTAARCFKKILNSGSYPCSRVSQMPLGSCLVSSFSSSCSFWSMSRNAHDVVLYLYSHTSVQRPRLKPNPACCRILAKRLFSQNRHRCRLSAQLPTNI